MAIILDGKALAAEMQADLTGRVALQTTPAGLAVVLVGEDPASQVYVRNKGKAVEAVGMRSFQHTLPTATSQAELLALIDELNHDPAVHGILVQLPLPAHIDTQTVLQAVSPLKDVDGFHPVNVGKLHIGLPSLVPCTPQGCIRLLKRYIPESLAGLNAVVLGRSNIVGKPMAALLLREDCSVTVLHSKSRDMEKTVKQADIVVAAIGRVNAVPASWVKEGAIVLDVGINRRMSESAKSVLCGDVDYAGLLPKVRAITPVPGA
jgi:methylenetetrahydrofolate dehydrogenase (NADP+) / methenyltetrahydrofolate cyclohydrolase